MNQPAQAVPECGGLVAYQSRITLDGRMFLVRAIADDRAEPTIVVTVYRTSKIAKYWRSI
jgi:hypothetical protein